MVNSNINKVGIKLTVMNTPRFKLCSENVASFASLNIATFEPVNFRSNSQNTRTTRVHEDPLQSPRRVNPMTPDDPTNTQDPKPEKKKKPKRQSTRDANAGIPFSIFK